MVESVRVIRVFFPNLWEKHSSLLKEIEKELTPHEEQNCISKDLLYKRSEVLTTDRLLKDKARVFYFLVGELMRCNGDCSREDYEQIQKVLRGEANVLPSFTKGLSSYARNWVQDWLNSIRS